MINKQNLWFVTLFSLILILGIYYVNLGDEVSNVIKMDNNKSPEVIEITSSDELVALEVEKEEEKQALMEEYQNILLDTKSTIEEKNNAYEKIQEVNNSKNDEDKIKKLIEETFNFKSFVKVKDNTINIYINHNKHDLDLANKIIRKVQELYKEEKYITVKFNK